MKQKFRECHHETTILSMNHWFTIKTWCYTGMYHFSTEYIHMLCPTEPWLKFLLMSLDRAVVLHGLLAHDWNFATLLEGAWSCCEANSSPPSINSNAQLSWFDPGGFFLRWVYGKSQLLRCAALPLFSTQHLWFNFFGFHSFSYWQACAPSVLVYNSFN